MKTFPLLLVMIGFCQVIQAQTIIYDYASRKYVPGDSSKFVYVRHLDLASYQLININHFARKVTIEGNLVSVTSDMPAQFNILFGINKANTQEKVADVQEQAQKMNVVKAEAEQKVVPSAPVSSTLTNFKTESKKLSTFCNTYYAEATKIDSALQVHKKLLDIMGDDSHCTAPLMTTALGASGIDSLLISRLHGNFNRFIVAYDSVYYQYSDAAIAARQANELVSEEKIKNAQDQVEKDHKALKQSYSQTLVSIDSLYAQALNPASYIVICGPMFVKEDADEAEFKIQVGNHSFSPTFYVKGGWKVDYSMGLVANFISDDSYFFETTPQSTTATGPTLVKRDKGVFLNMITPTVSPMLHLYRRNHKDVAWGGMFGISANVKELTDIGLGFLAGGSVMLGRSPKVFLSTGLSFSKVSVLKEPQYKAGLAYKDVKIEDVTERLLRPAWFFAISLGIGKRNVIKAN